MFAALTKLQHKTKACVSLVACAVLSLSLILTLGGCASSAPEKKEEFKGKDIEIKQQGFTVDANGVLHYAFIAVNPNDGMKALNTAFSIEAFDSNNNLVAGGGVTILTMYPNQECPGIGTAEIYSDQNPQATSTDSEQMLPAVSYIRVTCASNSSEWKTTTYDDAQLQEKIKIENAKMSSGSMGKLSINANIVSEFDKASMDAIAVLFDSQGNPIFGSEELKFECGKDAPYAAVFVMENPPAYSKAFIYVMPQSL